MEHDILINNTASSNSIKKNEVSENTKELSDISEDESSNIEKKHHSKANILDEAGEFSLDILDFEAEEGECETKEVWIISFY